MDTEKTKASHARDRSPSEDDDALDTLVPSTKHGPRKAAVADQLPQATTSTTAGGPTGDHKARLFGDYEVLEPIGRGGMGTVYRARHIPTDRFVALKVIRCAGLPDEFDSDVTVVDRFRHEAMAAARVEHDHVVAVYDAGECDGSHYYSMRLVQGEDLAKIAGRGPMDCRSAATYLAGAARGVEAAHAQGILHRDLKPHNILLDQAADRALVADFGLARLYSSDLQTQTGEVLGTPSYMPPEQIMNASEVTPASDVYSLGATLYHLITGRPPFQAASTIETIHQVHGQDPVSPRALIASVDRDLETIVLRCLEKSPDRRYQSCAELADELQRYLDGKPILARPVSPAGRAMRWGRRNPRLATASALALASLLLGTIVSTTFAIQSDRNAQSWERETARANRLAGIASARQADAAAALYDSLISNAQLHVEQRNEQGWSWRAEDSLSQASEIRPPDADLHRLRSLWTTAWIADDVRRIGSVAEGIDTAAIAVSNDGKRMAVGQRKHNVAASIQIFDLATMERLRTLAVSDMVAGFASLVRGERFQEGVEALEFSHDGRWLFAGTRLGAVMAWDLDDPTSKPHRWKVFEDGVAQLHAASAENQVFAISSSRSGSELRAYAWNSSDEQWQGTESPLASARGIATSNHHGVVVASPKSVLARYDADRKVLSSGAIVTVDSLRMHPSGTSVAGIADTSIRMVDVQSGVETQTLRLPSLASGIDGFDFAAGGDRIVLASRDPNVLVIDGSGKLISELETPGRSRPAVRCSATTPHFAITQLDHVEIFEFRESSIRSRTDRSSGAIEDIAFSEDGHTVFSTTRVGLPDSVDIQLDVWDFASGQRINKFHVKADRDASSLRSRIAVDGDHLAVAIPGVGFQVWNRGDAPSGDQASRCAGLYVDLNHHDRLMQPRSLVRSGLSFDIDTFAYSEAADRCVSIIGSNRLVGWASDDARVVADIDSTISAVFTGTSELTAACCTSEWLVVGRRDGLAMVSDMRTIGSPRVERFARSRIECLATVGDHVVVGTEAGRLKWADLTSLECGQLIEAFDTAVSTVALSDNGDLMVAGDVTGELGFWTRGDDGNYQEWLRVNLGRRLERLCLNESGTRMVIQLENDHGVECWDLERLHAKLDEQGLRIEIR